VHLFLSFLLGLLLVSSPAGVPVQPMWYLHCTRYSWINLYMTWNKAQQFCRVNYTDLVSIRNEGENVEIMKKAQGSPFWIGLFNDPWKWSDGAQSKFKKWKNWEPNNWNLNEKCVEIRPDGTWNDADCSLQKQFICSQSK
uniref:C-type lectin domain-containing protein n=1 Tax=Erpetoichthys calabaricus TaxID=27687 RepID=A0A8C4RTI7_ERPCA